MYRKCPSDSNKKYTAKFYISKDSHHIYNIAIHFNDFSVANEKLTILAHICMHANSRPSVKNSSRYSTYLKITNGRVRIVENIFFREIINQLFF